MLCDCNVLMKHPEQVDKNKLYGAGGLLIRKTNQEKWHAT
jgi:hypothetical protein